MGLIICSISRQVVKSYDLCGFAGFIQELSTKLSTENGGSRFDGYKTMT
jgi:hypothetical protein